MRLRRLPVKKTVTLILFSLAFPGLDLVSCTNKRECRFNSEVYKTTESEALKEIVFSKADSNFYYRSAVESLSFDATNTDLDNKRTEVFKPVLLMNSYLEPVINYKQNNIDSLATCLECHHPGLHEDFLVDTVAYKLLIINLLDSIKTKVKIDFGVMSKLSSYKIRDSKDSSTLKEPYKKIGLLALSRISFDKKFDKGCFYIRYTLANGMERNELILLRRERGTWKILVTMGLN